MKQFTGRTLDAQAPFLNAEFWREGLEVTGVVTKVFEVENERNGVAKKTTAYVLSLQDSVEVDGEETDRVSVGTMAGIKMALEAAGVYRLQLRDVVTITCEGVTASKKEGYSPRVNFKIDVKRP